ncbi:ABC-type transporter, periplasmic subunit [Sulfobacillus acidophilus DSM 10332]|uniref:ABC-type transporter, periplasmic subunit n=1 Tax=Sulfobacillus acidophilus (strain ATCC 700253 / DSM 10332 / NAL) TaxID=679936 RepID=G8U1D8_SULAD|nr:ABC-type transporter, periplasmic subunit [Sulfobacillus acidophilus DSM 10332]
MKSRRLALAASLTTAVALAAAGCGSTSQTPSSTPSTPQSGGTIVYALPPQTNLNWYIPIVNSGYDSLYNFQLIYQLYKPLIYIGSNYAIDWGSSIAKNITYNAQGTVYHIFLNPKWTWSNGKPVTSQDILFTWNVIKATSAPNAPQPWPYVMAGVGDIPNGVQSIVANGPDEVTITLKQPANQEWFIYNGIAQLTPMPSAVWNKYPTNISQEITYLGQQGTNPSFDSVVDGPYMLKNAVSSQSWTLVPNPHYAGHKAYATIVMAYEGSNAAEFAALKTNQVQVGYLDLSEYGARSQLTNDLIRPGYPFAYFDIELNLHKNAKNNLGPVFNQLYVRQALEMGINQQAINTDIYHGYAPPQYGPIPVLPKTPFLDPKLTKPLYPYNPAAGKKLLEDYGWKMVNGVMTKNGVPLSFTMIYSSGSTASDEMMALIQQGWKQEGVNVTLQPIPFANLEGTISGAPSGWDAAGSQGIIYGGSYPTGGELFGTGGGLNNMGFSDPTEDALIKATHQPYPTAAQSMKAYLAYEDYTAKVLPVLWNNNVGTLIVTAKTVHNAYKYSNPTVGYPQFQYWWIAH